MCVCANCFVEDRVHTLQPRGGVGELKSGGVVGGCGWFGGVVVILCFPLLIEDQVHDIIIVNMG